jgi:hypothetical protein
MFFRLTENLKRKLDMPTINGKYYTQREVEEMERKARRKSSDTDDFVTSVAVGAVTGSAVLGAVVGGSLLGGLLGDALEGTDDNPFL